LEQKLDNAIPLLVFFVCSPKQWIHFSFPLIILGKKLSPSAPPWESKSEQTFFNNSKMFKVHITVPHHFQIVEEALSGTWRGPRPLKAQVLGCINGAQKGGIVSDSGSTPWYSRWKYVPLRHA
jgi:hypothetical protein